MKSVETSLVIDAPTDAVFAVLADLATWHTWNPVITQIRGELRVGAPVAFKIAVVERVPPLRLRAKLVEFEPGRALAWRGGLPAMLVGHHYFRTEARGESRCLVTHGESFTGIVSRGLPARLLARLTTAYDRLNVALRDEVLRRRDAS